MFRHIYLGLLISLALGFLSLAKADRPYFEILDHAATARSMKVVPGRILAPGEVSGSRMLLDNDKAFQSKLDAIRSAQPGEVIRVVYFIWDTDLTSSAFTSALLEASFRGAEVRILTDYFTNYSNFDLFAALEEYSEGRIQVRLYNRPSVNMLKDAIYMSMACPDESKRGNITGENCKAEKLAALDQIVAEQTDPADPSQLLNLHTTNSSLFMSGLYSKNSDALAGAVIEGQAIDMSKLQSSDSPPLTAEEKAGLAKVAKLYVGAKLKGNVFDAIQLWLAAGIYGDALAPLLNGLDNVLPFGVTHSDTASEEWAHLTDYTHHKLLLVGERIAQLGGRNIQDSYHMRPTVYDKKPILQKYGFIDTDLYVEFDESSKFEALWMKRSFDRLWNFREMVATLDDVRTHANFDFVANAEAIKAANAECKVDLSDEEPSPEVQAAGANGEDPTAQVALAEYQTKVARCSEQKLASSYKDEQTRTADAIALVQGSSVLKTIGNAQKYSSTYASVRDDFDPIDPQAKRDPSYMGEIPLGRDATVSYLENLPFKSTEDRTAKEAIYRGFGASGTTGLDQRTFGAKAGEESSSSKYIHQFWVRALQNVCEASAGRGAAKQWVVLNNAYVIFPSNLAKALMNMMNGTWDCSNVELRIITNSISTTDLDIINPLSRMALHAFFIILQHEYDAERAAGLRLYEYNDVLVSFEGHEVETDENGEEKKGAKVSLHSKVSVLGEDIFVGSANADARSFMMDTNNGFLIQNSSETYAHYMTYLTNMMDEAEVAYQRELDGVEIAQADLPTLKAVTGEYFALSNNTGKPLADLGKTAREGYRFILAQNLKFFYEGIVLKWGGSFMNPMQKAQLEGAIATFSDENGNMSYEGAMAILNAARDFAASDDADIKVKTLVRGLELYVAMCDDAYRLMILSLGEYPHNYLDNNKEWLFEAFGLEKPEHDVIQAIAEFSKEAHGVGKSNGGIPASQKFDSIFQLF